MQTVWADSGIRPLICPPETVGRKVYTSYDGGSSGERVAVLFSNDGRNEANVGQLHTAGILGDSNISEVSYRFARKVLIMTE